MKLGTTIAALALIGAGAAATTPALADSKEPPRALTAPKSSFAGNSESTAKPRNFTFQGKSGTQSQMLPQPATTDTKK